MSYCLYYQAKVFPPKCWFFVAVLRSFEHIAFDRTADVSESIFEFFVPADTEIYFLQVLACFQEQGIVTDLKKLDNRFISI
jgi:hypothetical protein